MYECQSGAAGGGAAMKRKRIMRLCRMVASDAVVGLAYGVVAVAVGHYD